MGRIQVTLAAIVIVIASLVVSIAILARWGDGSTGPMPGQFGIEKTGESKATKADI